MTIGRGTALFPKTSSAATSLTVDITSFTTGEWCYCLIYAKTSEASFTFTGWTAVTSVVSQSLVQAAQLWRRKKVGGDTTFTVSWPNSVASLAVVEQYTGLDPTTPDEGANLVLVGSASNVFPTSSATPTSFDRWAACIYGALNSNSAQKTVTWTYTSGITEVGHDANTTAASSPWPNLALADSGAAVAQSAQSYTGTSNNGGGAAIGNGIACILFLIPAPSAWTQTSSDPEGITDAASQVAAYAQTPTDPEGLTDSAGQVATYSQTPTDAENLTDSAGQAATYPRSQTDPEGLTDAANQVAAYSQTFSDSVGVTDSVARDIARPVTDPVGLTDAASQVSAASRTQTDPENLTDAAAQVSVYSQAPIDPVGLTDAVTAVKTVLVTQSDPVGITDSASQVTAASQTASDPVGLSDTAGQAAAYSQSDSDPVGITDSASYVKTIAQTPTDPVGLADSASQVSAAAQTPTDAEGITDSAAWVAAASQSPTDGVGLTDVVTAVKSVLETFTDPEGITDSVTQGLDTAQSPTDPVGLTDTPAQASTFLRKILNQTNTTPFDPVGLTDSVTQEFGTTQSATDPVGVTDSVTFVVFKVVKFTDLLGLTDSQNVLYVPGGIIAGTSTSSDGPVAVSTPALVTAGNTSGTAQTNTSGCTDSLVAVSTSNDQILV